MAFFRQLGLLIFGGFWISLIHAAGFSFIEVPADDYGPELDGGVWSPCALPAGSIELGHLEIEGVFNCPVSGAALPVIVISHGHSGSFLDQRDTAQALADAGFVVAAINHSDDNYQLRGGPRDTFSALSSRPTDVQRLLDFLLLHWSGHEALAPEEIGFYGFSRGGYTGLVLAGANPDFHRLPPISFSPCATAPNSAACAEARQRFQALLDFPLIHDSRIRAAVIVDPLSDVFDEDGLKQVKIPIQLWVSAYGGDGVSPTRVAELRRNLPIEPDWRPVENATHFGFLMQCSPAMSASHQDICRDPPGFNRLVFHREFNAQMLEFFRRYLVNPSR